MVDQVCFYFVSLPSPALLLLLLPPPSIFIKADPALEKNPVELATDASAVATGCLISTAAATTAAVPETEAGVVVITVSVPVPCPCCCDLSCKACLALSSFSANVRGFSSFSFPGASPVDVVAADTGTAGSSTAAASFCVVSVATADFLAFVTGAGDVFAVGVGVVDDFAGLLPPLGPWFGGAYRHG